MKEMKKKEIKAKCLYYVTVLQAFNMISIGFVSIPLLNHLH